MKKHIAFVFGGGGARGALQAGALRALVEAGIKPDLLVGTSIGAINATFWALHGMNMTAVDMLFKAWEEASALDLLPSNYLYLTVRTLFNRPEQPNPNSIRGFVISHGVSPELTFEQVQAVRLVLVSADLNNHQPKLFGLDPKQNVLEGVLASGALPPWVHPVEKEGQLLLDGGIVSNVPIDIALNLGATEIIALDLDDPHSAPTETRGFGSLVNNLILTVQMRQTELSLALAEAREVPVLHLKLHGLDPVHLWDFTQGAVLMAYGYAQTKAALPAWIEARKPWWKKAFKG